MEVKIGELGVFDGLLSDCAQFITAPFPITAGFTP